MRSSHDHVLVAGAPPVPKRPTTDQLYCQEHVFVFSQSASSNSNDNNAKKSAGVWIPGFLAVFSADVPRLCWTSYEKVRVHASERDRKHPPPRLSPLQVNEIPERPMVLEQFTLKLALSQIASLWKHTPEVGRGVPVVTVTLDDMHRTELPPFLFYHGGVRELFHAVRTLVPISRSKDDPDLYLVNDQSNILMRSVSCAEEFTGNDSGTPGAPPEVGFAASAEEQHKQQPQQPPPKQQSGGVVSSALSVLTTFGRIARAAAVGVSQAQQKEVHVATKVENVERSAEFKTSLGEFQVVEDYAPVKTPEEVARLAKLMAKPVRSDGVEADKWIGAFDNEGRIMAPQQRELLALAFSGGICPTVRREMWKYLLNYYPWDSTCEEREALRRAREQEYNGYKSQWQTITPLQIANFRKFRDRKHMIEKDVMRTDRTEPYFSVAAGFGDDSNHFDPSQNPHLQVLHDILVTYSMFNFDLSYVQGMNDLLSPILTIMDDEVDAFWCFVGLMNRMGPNFRKDQSGMSTQLRRLQSLVRHLDEPLFEYLKSVACDNLYFTFRWMLLHFKRELDYDGVKMVWEAIWSSPDPDHFHLFIVFAVLQQVRDHIIMEKLEFDSLVQLCNGMSGKLQYPELLSAATHWLYLFPKLFPDEAERARIFL